MRVASIFKRLLGLGAVSVTGVEVAESDGEQVVVVELARRRNRRMSCSGCGRRCRAIYDRSVRSWRHLDLFRVRCLIRAEVRRVACPSCGVRAEAVPGREPARARRDRSRTRACGLPDRPPRASSPSSSASTGRRSGA
jgi:transposase